MHEERLNSINTGEYKDEYTLNCLEYYYTQLR